jgi:hypothetical protein
MRITYSGRRTMTEKRAGKYKPEVSRIEAGWKIDGESRWLWAFISEKVAFFRIEQSRSKDVIAFSSYLCTSLMKCIPIPPITVPTTATIKNATISLSLSSFYFILLFAQITFFVPIAEWVGAYKFFDADAAGDPD